MKLKEFILQTASDIKSLVSRIGTLTGLKTTAKTSLVDAVNELYERPSSSVSINDTVASSASTYSSTKIDGDIAIAKSQVKNEILGGASAAFDTLKELETQLKSDESTAAALATQVNNRVRFDDVQTLTTAQKQQVAQNIGIDDPTVDYLATYTTARGNI